MGLVKVAVLPNDYSEMDQLQKGLFLLNKSDPSVQYFTNAKGELILSTCGEVHLERCIKDLNDDFCPGVKLEISEPIIPFRETILNKRLTNRVIQNKQADYEEIDSQSESSEDEGEKLANVKKHELTVGEMIKYNERLEKYNEQLAIEKELLKKEQ